MDDTTPSDNAPTDRSREPRAARRGTTTAKAPVLGNDPFLRGAAPRVSAAPAAPAPTPPPVERPPAPTTAAERHPPPRRKRPLHRSAPSRLSPHPAPEPPGPIPRERALAAPGRTRRQASPSDWTGRARHLMERALERATDAASALRGALASGPPALPEEEVDAFGADPSAAARAQPVLDFLCDSYFRLETRGAERVPKGACLVVCNHSGGLPIDGPMVKAVLRRSCERADARWLVEDAIFYAPFLGTWLNRLGAVRACPENAERLLSQGVALAVFPEGLLGISKPIGSRYRLQRFGRGGFVKLAMRARVPIIPAAIVGAEEATPLLAKIPTRSLGIPYIPVTPTFPLLGPLGLVPLPSKWTVSFLPPVDVTKYGAAGAEDLALVARNTEAIRDAIHLELERIVSARASFLRG